MDCFNAPILHRWRRNSLLYTLSADAWSQLASSLHQAVSYAYHSPWTTRSHLAALAGHAQPAPERQARRLLPKWPYRKSIQLHHAEHLCRSRNPNRGVSKNLRKYSFWRCRWLQSCEDHSIHVDDLWKRHTRKKRPWCQMALRFQRLVHQWLHPEQRKLQWATFKARKRYDVPLWVSWRSHSSKREWRCDRVGELRLMEWRIQCWRRTEDTERPNNVSDLGSRWRKHYALLGSEENMINVFIWPQTKVSMCKNLLNKNVY